MKTWANHALLRTRSAVTAEAAAYGTLERSDRTRDSAPGGWSRGRPSTGGRCLSGEHPASSLRLSSTTQPPRQLRVSLSLSLGVATRVL
jgi:hypothetical protein